MIPSIIPIETTSLFPAANSQAGCSHCNSHKGFGQLVGALHLHVQDVASHTISPHDSEGGGAQTVSQTGHVRRTLYITRGTVTACLIKLTNWGIANRFTNGEANRVVTCVVTFWVARRCGTKMDQKEEKKHLLFKKMREK